MRWPSRNTAMMLGGRVPMQSKLRNEVRWLMYRSARVVTIREGLDMFITKFVKAWRDPLPSFEDEM